MKFGPSTSAQFSSLYTIRREFFSYSDIFFHLLLRSTRKNALHYLGALLFQGWFSRYVIAAMLVDENKRFLISSFCSSTSNIVHCSIVISVSLSLEIGCKLPIGRFQKYHRTLSLSPKIWRKHCVHFLLGLTMVLRENKNNAYAKLWKTNKEY